MATDRRALHRQGRAPLHLDLERNKAALAAGSFSPTMALIVLTIHIAVVFITVVLM